MCEYSSCDTRVKSLIDSIEVFIDEMEVFHHLGENIPLFKSFLGVYDEFKMVLFGFVLLLNFHVIISMVNYSAFLSAYSDFSSSVLQIKIVLGVVCWAGYVVLLVFQIIPAIPMRRRSLNRDIALQAESSDAAAAAATATVAAAGGGGKGRGGASCCSSYDYSALTTPVWLSLFFFSACLIHFYDFSERHDAVSLYIQYTGVYVALAVPVFAYYLRKLVGTPGPKSRIEFVFCIVMDLLMDSQIQMACFFVGVAMVGLGYHYSFFSLLLLDFLTLSEDARNTVRSVTKPWRSLLSLVVIFLVVLVIFGIFGYAYFSPGMFLSQAGALNINAQGQLVQNSDINCESMMDCLGLVLYGGIRSSDIASVMQQVYPNSEVAGFDFAGRFFYDLLFFITIGALLFNMLTGIIVDTFSELR